MDEENGLKRSQIWGINLLLITKQDSQSKKYEIYMQLNFTIKNPKLLQNALFIKNFKKWKVNSFSRLRNSYISIGIIILCSF